MAITDNIYATQTGTTVLTQGLFELSANRQYDFGHAIRLNDGRTFKYAKCGGVALAAGVLLQSAVKGSAASDLINCVLTGTTPVVAGSTTMTVTLANSGSTYGLAANELTGGFLNVNDATGEGYQYKVKSNTALATTVAGIVELADPLRLAVVAASSEVTLQPSEFNGAIISPTTVTGLPLGISPVAVTLAAPYFWCQTYGNAIGLQGSVWVLGNYLSPSLSTAGSIIAQLVANTGVHAMSIGYPLRVGVDTEYGPLFLTLQS